MSPVRLATFDPTKNIAGAPTKEIADKFRAIGKVLGVPEPIDDIGKVKTAFEELLASAAAESGATPAAIEATALSLGLSKREAKMLADMRSDPRRYIELKAQRSYQPARRR